MAKETVTVDNKLDEIKLEKREKMDRKKKEKEEKKNKNKKSFFYSTQKENGLSIKFEFGNSTLQLTKDEVELMISVSLYSASA